MYTYIYRVAQNKMSHWAKCSFSTTNRDFLTKISGSELPPNSLDVNFLDYHVWGVMVEHYKNFHPKPKNTEGLKKVLQLI